MLTVQIVLTMLGCGLVSCRGPELRTYGDHICIRPCEVDRPQNCYYDFVLQYYYTLSKACYDCPSNTTDCARRHCIPADGNPRGILVVNRMIPGPPIHVCEGDNVIVNVVNNLQGAEGTSIHWHGVLQHGSQHMDGVSMVTQCAIPASSSFEYKFIAANAGTHFWHAHSGLQRTDGLFGAIVVRQADEREPHLGLYEDDLPEHTILVNDWLLELSVNRFASHHHAGGDNKPKSMLINGKGMYFDRNDNSTTSTPVEVFRVTRGRRYRFRTISNGVLNCPIQVSIDDHNMTMIASDGNAFEKLEVQSFNIFAGERYDFVLDASLPVGNYWVRVRGLADCGVYQAKQVAILRYEGAPDEMPTETITWDDAKRAGKKLNPWNKEATDELVPVSELTTLNTATFKDIPDKKFYMAMDFNKIDNYHFHDKSFYPIRAVEKAKHLYMPQMNHISTILPPSPPLSQLADLHEGMFCNQETMGHMNCTEEFCECVFRLQVALHDEVEIVMIDEGVTFNANHPMHLHGHAFRVVGMGKLGKSTSLAEIKGLDEQGLLHRNLTHAVAKDTVTVPDGGYSILRFHADNPGFWFFHCHIEFHVDIGMGLLLQVGNKNDMPKVPKNFPKCGNWRFRGEYSSDNDQCVSGASKVTAITLTSLVTLMIVLNTVNF